MDRAEAAAWFRQAAEDGDGVAQILLGEMYESGDGVRKDSVEAVRWWRKAAEQGFPTVLFNLCYVYSQGKPGVPADKVESFKWCILASDRGYRKAEKVIDLYRAELSSGEIEKATTSAQAWRDAYWKSLYPVVTTIPRIVDEKGGIRGRGN